MCGKKSESGVQNTKYEVSLNREGLSATTSILNVWVIERELRAELSLIL